MNLDKADHSATPAWGMGSLTTVANRSPVCQLNLGRRFIIRWFFVFEASCSKGILIIPSPGRSLVQNGHRFARDSIDQA